MLFTESNKWSSFGRVDNGVRIHLQEHSLYFLSIFTGRCVAEMQIGGVETEYTKRPYDYSVSFVLRSLLIVDALQTFGPEYKLLVSSQKAASATKRKGNILLICRAAERCSRPRGIIGK